MFPHFDGVAECAVRARDTTRTPLAGDCFPPGVFVTPPRGSRLLVT